MGEDVSNELRDLIRLIPDHDMALPFALSHTEHFNKKKPSSKVPKPLPSPSGASGPAPPPDGLGFPIHFLPSVRQEVHKKPKTGLMKMIRLAMKKSKKVDEKKKGDESTKKAEAKEAEAAEAKATGNAEKAKKLEEESKE